MAASIRVDEKYSSGRWDAADTDAWIDIVKFFNAKIDVEYIQYQYM